MRRTIATLIAAAFACAVVACGDSGDGSDSAGAKTTPSKDANATPSDDAAEDGTTPAGGEDTDLGDFGRAPTKAERAAIVAAVDRYHAAVAADDDARICATMSRAGKRALSRNVAGGRSARCVDHVDVLYSGYTDQIRDSLLDAKIATIRIKGDHALVIATIPGRAIRLPMDSERGTWLYGNFGKWSVPALAAAGS